MKYSKEHKPNPLLVSMLSSGIRPHQQREQEQNQLHSIKLKNLTAKGAVAKEILKKVVAEYSHITHLTKGYYPRYLRIKSS